MFKDIFTYIIMMFMNIKCQYKLIVKIIIFVQKPHTDHRHRSIFVICVPQMGMDRATSSKHVMASCRDFDVFDLAGWNRDGGANLPQTIEVKLDGFANLRFNFFDARAGRYAAG